MVSLIAVMASRIQFSSDTSDEAHRGRFLYKSGHLYANIDSKLRCNGQFDCCNGQSDCSDTSDEAHCGRFLYNSGHL